MIPSGRPFSPAIAPTRPTPSANPSSSTLSPLAPPFNVVDVPTSPTSLVANWPRKNPRSKPFSYAPSPFPQWSGDGDGDADEGFGCRPNPSFGPGANLEGFNHYEVYPLSAARERHSTYEDHPYGGWHQTYDNVWNGNGHFSSGSSEWLQDKQTGRQDVYPPFNSSAPYMEPTASYEMPFYTSVPSSTSGQESSSSYMLKSPYDKYIEQLGSCLADHIPFHPTTSCSTSTQVFASPRVGTSSSMTTMSKLGVHNRVVVRKPDSKKESDAGKGDNVKLKDNHVKETGASAKTVLPTVAVGNEGSSTTKFNTGLKIESLTTASASSTSRTTELDNYLKHSAEADTVDSPCWRGAASSRVSPYTIGETENLHTIVNVGENFNEVGHAKEDLSKVVGSSNVPVEVRSTNAKDCALKLRESSSVISSRMLGKPGASNEDGLEGELEIVHPDGLAEKTKDEEKERGPTLQKSGTSNEENIGVNRIQVTDRISHCKKGSEPLPSKNFKDLAKEILNISVDLLCAEFDMCGVEGDAFRPLISARNNIDIILKDKKIHSRVGDEGNLKECRDHDAQFRNINQINKTVDDVMMKTLPEREGNSEGVLYKNLWLEAEALVCKLKYELKLASMKDKMRSYDALPLGKPPTPSSSSRGTCINDYYGCEPANAQRSIDKPSFSHWSETESGDPLVLSSNQSSQMIESGNLDTLVMAEYKTRMDLASKENIWMRNKPRIPNYEGEGSSSGTKQPFYNSVVVDANNAVLQDTALSSLGLPETRPWPYGRDKIWTPPVQLKPLNVTGVKYNDNIGPNFYVPNDTTMDSLTRPPSHTTKRRGNSSHAAGYESPFYEWEHVFRDEST